MAAPARVGALVLSDVVNNPLDVIASGPAVADSSTFQDAQAILQKYLDPLTIPESIRVRISRGCRGEVEETLKQEDEIASHAFHTIIASSQVSSQAALRTAGKLGFDAEILTNALIGEARDAGVYLATTLNSVKKKNKPYLGIAGGETTVNVKGSGLGGRNLEVALAAVEKLASGSKELLITLATDGEDGPTNSAGAFITSDTLVKTRQLGLNPQNYLDNNDAYHFFEQTGGLLLTGPSGTNVNDLNFIFKF